MTHSAQIRAVLGESAPSPGGTDWSAIDAEIDRAARVLRLAVEGEFADLIEMMRRDLDRMAWVYRLMLACTADAGECEALIARAERLATLLSFSKAIMEDDSDVHSYR